MIGVGEERGGLFHLIQPAKKKKKSAKSDANFAILKNPSIDLWHFSLGHFSN